jgi:hypothetical protein
MRVQAAMRWNQSSQLSLCLASRCVPEATGLSEDRFFSVPTVLDEIVDRLIHQHKHRT